jgi:hypothetical protein
MGGIAFLVGAALVAWFVLDSLRSRERAVALGRQACQRAGVLFLDDTVHCVKTRFARDGEGRLAFRRVYAFEFSETGNNRRAGAVVMLGPRVESVDMEPYLAEQ